MEVIFLEPKVLKASQNKVEICWSWKQNILLLPAVVILAGAPASGAPELLFSTWQCRYQNCWGKTGPWYPDNGDNQSCVVGVSYCAQEIHGTKYICKPLAQGQILPEMLETVCGR